MVGGAQHPLSTTLRCTGFVAITHNRQISPKTSWLGPLLNKREREDSFALYLLEGWRWRPGCWVGTSYIPSNNSVLGFLELDVDGCLNLKDRALEA